MVNLKMAMVSIQQFKLTVELNNDEIKNKEKVLLPFIGDFRERTKGSTLAYTLQFLSPVP